MLAPLNHSAPCLIVDPHMRATRKCATRTHWKLRPPPPPTRPAAFHVAEQCVGPAIIEDTQETDSTALLWTSPLCPDKHHWDWTAVQASWDLCNVVKFKNNPPAAHVSQQVSVFITTLLPIMPSPFLGFASDALHHHQ